jgi:hypothetical protein
LARELITIIAAIGLTALCWGSYGPVLHKGQESMGGSRMRPFLCVGLAYFAIAVLVPTVILFQGNEPGGWSFSGILWSLVAGATGAVGALGIIMAFNFGGRPVYVMPLVFGGAPVVNTFTTITRSVVQYGTVGDLRLSFLASLVLVVVGAVLVLVFAPRPSAAPRLPAEGKPESPAKPAPATASPEDPASSTDSQPGDESVESTDGSPDI